MGPTPPRPLPAPVSPARLSPAAHPSPSQAAAHPDCRVGSPWPNRGAGCPLPTNPRHPEARQPHCMQPHYASTASPTANSPAVLCAWVRAIASRPPACCEPRLHSGAVSNRCTAPSTSPAACGPPSAQPRVSAHAAARGPCRAGPGPDEVRARQAWTRGVLHGCCPSSQPAKASTGVATCGPSAVKPSTQPQPGPHQKAGRGLEVRPQEARLLARWRQAPGCGIAEHRGEQLAGLTIRG